MRHLLLSVLVVVGACTARPTASPLTTVTQRVGGLREPAEILVDRWGVPHIYARNLDDLFFTQGFNAARDRLWQLDVWKRRGDGTLAEVLGPAFVEKDRAARLLLFRGDMYTEWLAYASDTKRIVSAFVAGINAYIRLTRERPDLLPLEFRWLDYAPALWTPETVVRIRSHGLLRNLRSEVARATLLREHGETALSLVDRLEPPHVTRVPEGLELDAIHTGILDVYRLGTSPVRFASPPQLGRRLSAVPSPPARGSNNWAVAASRTATGRPLLADDPHRTQSVPSLRYIAHLSSPGVAVIGAGEPALPGVSIGHNGRIAFGLTIFNIDQEDLYVYETRPGQPHEYRYRDRWEPMQSVRETIAVRDGAPVDVELRFTRHGPVLHEDTEGRHAYAVRAAWLEPGMAPYLGSIEYMRARDWDAFLAAMNRWGAPSENQVYADTDGNIGWKPGGRAPVRPNWDGLLPVPGDGRYEWAGFLDGDMLPVEANPERGFVHTANEMNLPPGFPPRVGYEWRPGFRSRRIAEVLAAERALTAEDCLALQTDYLSLPARRVVSALVDLEAADPQARRALELLRSWDFVLRPESGAAALFEVWFRRHLGPALIARTGLDATARAAVGGGHVAVRVELVERPDARLGSEPRQARDAAVNESLARAVEETEALLGEDWSVWRWGDLHRIELRHPLEAQMPAELRPLAHVGPAPRGGSGETVGNTYYRPEDFLQVSGASLRMVIDIGEWDRSLAMNAPGQSGDLRSPHYRDLFEPWAKDRAFPLLWSRAAVEQATERRLQLEPAR